MLSWLLLIMTRCMAGAQAACVHTRHFDLHPMGACRCLTMGVLYLATLGPCQRPCTCGQGLGSLQGFQYSLCQFPITTCPRIMHKPPLCLNFKVCSIEGETSGYPYFCTLVCAGDAGECRQDETLEGCLVTFKLKCSLHPGTHAVVILGKDAFGHTFDGP
jgi:hypothetical protein